MNAREPSRVREQGTIVTQPKSPEERIAAVRGVVTEGQYAKVDGIMLDLFSASAIVAVYDALNETNRARFSGLHVGQMARLAFKLAK